VTTRRSGRQRGQSLVEFALVIPIFLTMLIALVEFTFIFNAILAANYASRDAALLAAEAGSDLGADCAVLKAVEADIGAPANRSQIQTVEIFEATAAGSQTGAATVYARSGTLNCTLPDGTAITVPYTRTANGYAMASRCNILVGCPLIQATPHLDHVGVRVTYRHTWRTPFGSTFGPHLDVVKSNSMRMEPVL
jgi:Flp pilus assembly protein TadG